jgi:AraC-like DNA-binding protein
LHQITDVTIEFEKKLAPDINEIHLNSSAYLNNFFFNKLTQSNHGLLPIIADIKKWKGQLTVTELAKKHFTTTKQLERNFNQYVGITPKEFLNLVRFQCVLPAIKNRSSKDSLSDVAFENGYYDHAHLANEVKRYTGVAPTEL